MDRGQSPLLMDRGSHLVQITDDLFPSDREVNGAVSSRLYKIPILPYPADYRNERSSVRIAKRFALLQ